MPYFLFTSYHVMWPVISLPLQMAERLLRARPVSVAKHVDRSELARILLIYVLRIFVYYMYV